MVLVLTFGVVLLATVALSGLRRGRCSGNELPGDRGGRANLDDRV